jgi:outer membrane receptor for monomeric catechols
MSSSRGNRITKGWSNIGHIGMRKIFTAFIICYGFPLLANITRCKASLYRVGAVSARAFYGYKDSITQKTPASRQVFFLKEKMF